MGSDDLDAVLGLAVSVAAEAAALLAEGAGRVRTSVETKSTRTDMVTEMDRASEALIVQRLLSARPDDGILGEEGTTRPGTSGLRWVVDPLDGTTNYLYGYPSYGVSIAAEIDGRPAIGVVHDVAHGEVFTATAGGGARLGDRRLQVRGAPDLATALVGTGFSYDATRRSRQATVLSKVLPAVRDIRRAGAAAIDLCWVAAGRTDAFYERWLAPWDSAAGSLVAAEAGAWVDRLGDVTVAAAPHLADPFRALLEAAGATD